MKRRAYHIIFEDEHLVVLEKSAGVLSIQDRYDIQQKNIASLLEERYGKIFILHRLDKFTSGLMVFAKTQEAHRKLSQDFESHKVEKLYIAIIENIPQEVSGKIDIPIGYNSQLKKMTVQAKGKESITYFKILEAFDGFSFLKLKLETGRTHQIRVHLSYMSCPLLVDDKYGMRAEFFLSSIKRKYRSSLSKEERPLLNRTPLHANELSFLHPISQSPLKFTSETPKDMNAVLKQLRKCAPLKDQLFWK
ncbi:MAG: RluA family pseudouridine synthase [Bacteroidota bacterium]